MVTSPKATAGESANAKMLSTPLLDKDEVVENKVAEKEYSIRDDCPCLPGWLPLKVNEDKLDANEIAELRKLSFFKLLNNHILVIKRLAPDSEANKLQTPANGSSGSNTKSKVRDLLDNRTTSLSLVPVKYYLVFCVMNFLGRTTWASSTLIPASKMLGQVSEVAHIAGGHLSVALLS